MSGPLPIVAATRRLRPQVLPALAGRRVTATPVCFGELLAVLEEQASRRPARTWTGAGPASVAPDSISNFGGATSLTAICARRLPLDKHRGAGERAGADLQRVAPREQGHALPPCSGPDLAAGPAATSILPEGRGWCNQPCCGLRGGFTSRRVQPPMLLLGPVLLGYCPAGVPDCASGGRFGATDPPGAAFRSLLQPASKVRTPRAANAGVHHRCGSFATG